MIGLLSKEQIIGRKVTLPRLGEFTIVGITDQGSPSIYADRELFMDILWPWHFAPIVFDRWLPYPLEKALSLSGPPSDNLWLYSCWHKVRLYRVYRCNNRRQSASYHIYKMFVGEIIAMTTLTTIPGMAVMAYILNGISKIPMIGEQYLMNPLVFNQHLPPWLQRRPYQSSWKERYMEKYKQVYILIQIYLNLKKKWVVEIFFPFEN